MHLLHVGKNLREVTEAEGARNRARFDAHRVYVINLMSAPGSGKTTLLERTLEHLCGRLRIGVIEGDIQGSADADRLSRFGASVRQINTHGACHLDPRQVAAAADDLDLDGMDLLFIENVGNLVCPAEFDLGEADRVMLLSVTEGHDKPGKYPLMFRTADLLILNKIDLIGATDFDAPEALRVARALNPHLESLALSCRTGDGLDGWWAWIERRREHARLHWDGESHGHEDDHDDDHDHDRGHDHGHDHGRAPDHAHDHDREDRPGDSARSGGPGPTGG